MKGMARTRVWSQLQMLKRASKSLTVEAHPPTSSRASTSRVATPARAR